MPPRSSRPSASLAALVGAYAVVYLVWGSTYLAIRFALDTLPPFTLTGARLGVAGGLLWAVLRACGAAGTPWRVWLWSAWTGTVMLGAGVGGVTWAEQRITSGAAALLAAATPMWFVVMEWTQTRERPGVRAVVGLALGIAGIVLLVGPRDVVGGGAVDAVGAAVVLAGSLSWAAGSIYGRSWPRPEGAAMAAAQQMVGSGVVLLVLGALVGERVDVRAVSVASWLGWGYLVVFGSVLAFTAYTWLLRVDRPSRVGTYAFVNPVVAVVLGWAVLAEPMNARVVVAATAVVGAVVLIHRSRVRERSALPEPAPVAERAAP